MNPDDPRSFESTAPPYGSAQCNIQDDPIPPKRDNNNLKSLVESYLFMIHSNIILPYKLKHFLSTLFSNSIDMKFEALSTHNVQTFIFGCDAV